MVNNAEQKMTQATAKTVVGNALKNIGLGFIGYNDGTPYKLKAFANRTKGLIGGSIGPLTVTNAYIKHCEDTAQQVLKAFQSLPTDIEWSYDSTLAYVGNLQNFTFTVKTGKNTQRVIKFCWERHSTYAARLRYDSSYETYWFAMYVEDNKI
jgi:hypothetical protein